MQPPSELIVYQKSPIFYNSERVQQNDEVFCDHLRLEDEWIAISSPIRNWVAWLSQVFLRSVPHDILHWECLFSRKEQHRKINVIRSHCHEIYTEEINKIALSSDDDKRVIMTIGIHTLAYGHKNLKTL